MLAITISLVLTLSSVAKNSFIMVFCLLEVYVKKVSYASPPILMESVAATVNVDVLVVAVVFINVLINVFSSFTESE